MSSRPIPTTAPDVTAELIEIINTALEDGDATAGRLRTAEAQFVKIRAELQGHATPISRYCRVGLTAFWIDDMGRARIDDAFDLANLAAHALVSASATGIILAAEIESGPTETTDTVSDLAVAYSTLLLEVTTTV